MFQPLADGKPSGNFVFFADGFAGRYKEPGRALHCPSGLAVGPDGALYITDDKAGRIWRVTFAGDPDQGIEAAPVAGTGSKGVSGGALAGGYSSRRREFAGSSSRANGIDKRAGRARARRSLMARSPVADVRRLSRADGNGTPVGANLTSGKWLWGDGSLAAITDSIKNGIPEPKQHPGAMPPMSEVALSDEDLAAVAAYVWSIGHRGGT